MILSNSATAPKSAVEAANSTSVSAKEAITIRSGSLYLSAMSCLSGDVALAGDTSEMLQARGYLHYHQLSAQR